MAGKLNDSQIKKWIREGKDISGVSAGDGLYFRLKGRKATWRFRHTVRGRVSAPTVGEYPAMTLAQARIRVHELKAKVAEQGVTATEIMRREAEEVARRAKGYNDSMTVEQLFMKYYEARVSDARKNPGEFLRKARADIFPSIGAMKASDVTSFILIDVLARVKKRAPTMANRLLTEIKLVFKFAANFGVIDRDPAASISKKDAGGVEKSRSRNLNESEIRAFLSSMRESEGFGRRNELAIKVIFATCVRKMELCAARWEEFDLEAAVWHLPEGRSKNGDAIDIPLATQVVEWLHELKRMACSSAYVMPGVKKNVNDGHISQGTLNAVLNRFRPIMPHIERFTVHDLRRTARTRLSKMGVSSDVAEACLNHKPRGMVAVYNEDDFFKEREEVMQMWADYLVAQDCTEDPGKVNKKQEGDSKVGDAVNGIGTIDQKQQWEDKAARMLNGMKEKETIFINTDLFCGALGLTEAVMREENGDVIIHDIGLSGNQFMAVSTGNTHFITRLD